jgi:hypothetical protein
VVLDIIEPVRPFTILWHCLIPRSVLTLILPPFLAKAIRLKAKVLDRAHGNKMESKKVYLRGTKEDIQALKEMLEAEFPDVDFQLVHIGRKTLRV